MCYVTSEDIMSITRINMIQLNKYCSIIEKELIKESII